MGKVFRRIAIVVIWILFFALCFYFPKLKLFPTEEKSISIFAWGDILSPKILGEFEQSTGIKVHLSYYSSNEELVVKMIATEGEGYDLIMPSDYATKILINRNLLNPIDHTKLTFWNNLNPALLHLPYDPDNRFSIPFEWELYGLGVNTTYFKNQSFTPSWGAIYNKNVIDYRIAAQNDPIEAVAISSFYLFGTIENPSQEKFTEVKNLLMEQRNWVEAYSDSRASYFIATGNCPVAMTTSSYIRRMIVLQPDIDFVVPEEGSFVSIENFAVSKKSEKLKYVYEFLNYLYSENSMKQHFNELGLIPAYQISLQDLSVYPYEKRLFEITPEQFQKYLFFKNIYPQQKVRDLWVEVKSF